MTLFLIPPVRFLASKRCTCTVTVILLLSEIMPIYSYYAEKKLVYIIIIAFSSCQPSFCFKCTKLNMHLSYNIRLVSNTKYIFRFLYNIYSLSQLLGGNTWWYTVLLT